MKNNVTLFFTLLLSSSLIARTIDESPKNTAQEAPSAASEGFTVVYPKKSLYPEGANPELYATYGKGDIIVSPSDQKKSAQTVYLVLRLTKESTSK